jgi:hypothetical protein
MRECAGPEVAMSECNDQMKFMKHGMFYPHLQFTDHLWSHLLFWSHRSSHRSRNCVLQEPVAAIRWLQQFASEPRTHVAANYAVCPHAAINAVDSYIDLKFAANFGGLWIWLNHVIQKNICTVFCLFWQTAANSVSLAKDYSSKRTYCKAEHLMWVKQ